MSQLKANAVIDALSIKITIGENKYTAAEGSTVTDLKYLAGNMIETVSGTIERIVVDTKVVPGPSNRIYDGVSMNSDHAINTCIYPKVTDIFVPKKIVVVTEEGEHAHVDIKMITEIGNIEAAAS